MKKDITDEASGSNFTPFTKDEQIPEIYCIFARDVQRHGLRSIPSVLQENVFSSESDICRRCMQCVCQLSHKNCNFSTICNAAKFNDRGTILVYCPTGCPEYFPGQFPLSKEICPVCNRAQGEKINECIPQMWPIKYTCNKKEIPLPENTSNLRQLSVQDKTKSNPVIRDMLKSICG